MPLALGSLKTQNQEFFAPWSHLDSTEISTLNSDLTDALTKTDCTLKGLAIVALKPMRVTSKLQFLSL